MKKIFVVFLFSVLTVVSVFAIDYAGEIGKKGDEAWSKIVNGNSRDVINPPVSAKVIASNFERYRGKMMVFPKFTFEDFVTDRNGEKYYYYGEGDDLFIIKYDSDITDILRRYTYYMGSAKDENWQLLGTVKDVFTWWGNVVLMDIKALRIESKITVIKEGGKLNFVAEDLLNKYVEEKASAGAGDIPRNLTSIPSGLDPRTVADLYWYLAAEENNRDVWDELISAKASSSAVRTYWKGLTKPGRTFFFVRVATDSPDKKKYFYQIRENGNDVGSPKPISLIMENGEWRVNSGFY